MLSLKDNVSVDVFNALFPSSVCLCNWVPYEAVLGSGARNWVPYEAVLPHHLVVFTLSSTPAAEQHQYLVK